MSSLYDKLHRFGLNQNQAAVYLASLEVGDCSVGSIEQRTGLHRQLIYNAAESLSELGLMKVSRRGGRRRFVSAQPSAFEEIALERFQQAKLLSENLAQVRKSAGFSGEARVFTGAEDIQQYYLSSVCRQAVRSRVDIIGVESRRYFEIFPKDGEAYLKIEKERIARKVRWRLLLSGKAEEEVRLNQGRKYVECRLLKENIAAPMDIMVWRDHVGLLIYGPDPIVMDIPGDAPARGFRKYLSLLWSRGLDITGRL